MSYEALSDTTRRSRKALLGFSATGIAVEWFGITINDIPAAGIEIQFAEGTVPQILAALVAYFFVVFVARYFVDIANMPKPLFFERIAAFANRRRENLRRQLAEKYSNAMRKEFSKDIKRVVDERMLQIQTEPLNFLDHAIGQLENALKNDRLSWQKNEILMTFGDHFKKEIRDQLFLGREIDDAILNDAHHFFNSIVEKIDKDIKIIAMERLFIVSYRLVSAFSLYFLDFIFPLLCGALAVLLLTGLVEPSLVF